MSSRRNRTFWNGVSRSYQADHGPSLDAQPASWGVWRIPEAKLGVLGPVQGLDVLELGCGAAQWTAALARAGAHATGLDISEQQLAHARPQRHRLSLVQGDAEALPFRTEVFDIVFADHGATTFASPEATVPEVARVLRPRGLFAFCMSSPIRDICVDRATDTVGATLTASYFDLTGVEDGESIQYQRPYGEWIRLFRRCQLVVEDLIELQAPSGATTTYAGFAPAAWAHRWPAEHIWKLRKAP